MDPIVHYLLPLYSYTLAPSFVMIVEPLPVWTPPHYVVDLLPPIMDLVGSGT